MLVQSKYAKFKTDKDPVVYTDDIATFALGAKRYLPEIEEFIGDWRRGINWEWAVVNYVEDCTEIRRLSQYFIDTLNINPKYISSRYYIQRAGTGIKIHTDSFFHTSIDISLTGDSTITFYHEDEDRLENINYIDAVINIGEWPHKFELHSRDRVWARFLISDPNHTYESISEGLS